MVATPLSTVNFHSYQSSPSPARRQVYELIDIMSPLELPFLKLVGIDGEAGKNPKFEWLEDTLVAETTTLSNAAAVVGTNLVGSTTGTTLVVASGGGAALQVGMLVKLTSATASNVAFEYVYIKATTSNSDQFTVVRNICKGTNATPSVISNPGDGVTGISWSNADNLDVVGLANRDNQDSPAKATTDLSIPFNYFEAFDFYYQISEVAANTDIYGVPQGDDARELDKAFKEVSIKLERAAFMGQRSDDTTIGADTIPRLMGGLDYFLNVGMNGAATNPYGASLASAQLTEKDLNDMLQDRYYTVGADNMGKTFLMGAWNHRRVSDMFAPYARSARNERVGGVVVDTLDTLWGPIDVLHSLRCPKSNVYLLNLDFIKIHPYNGLAFFDQELAKNGAYIKRQIYGVYTMSIRNAKAQGCIRLTATS